MIRDQEILDALLDSVRRFVRERLVPAENEVAETDEIPEAIVQEMRDLGLFGLTIPESFGGLELTMEEDLHSVRRTQTLHATLQSSGWSSLRWHSTTSRTTWTSQRSSSSTL